MKHKNIILRRRLAYVESQIEAESMSSRLRPILKEERRRRWTEAKNAIQKSLDSIVYPVLTLPVEITAEIFIRCLPDTPAPPSSTIAPMLLGRICRQWRAIACSTPRLWAALRVTLFEGCDVTLLARLWFGRAGSAPKSLSLRLPFRPCSNPFFTTIYRCQCCPSSLLFAGHWEHITAFHGTNLTPVECLALLSHTPRLTHCKFDNLKGGLPPSTTTSRVVLANLKHLSLDMYTHPSLLLLDSITCPALRSFSIIRLFRYVTNTSPLPFLERAPHIRALAIQFYSRNSGIITAILSAMPAVTSLRVVAEAAVTFDLLRLLSESPTFLPRITNIVLEPYTFVEWTDSEVKICIDAATSRWEAKSTAQVSDFELSYLNPPLDARVVACVSALKGKGMRIRVGPRHLTS